MAGNVKVGGNVIATHTGVEGAGTVTLSNVTASALKMSSSGNTITDSAGNAVLSESSGTVNINKGTLGSSVVFPAGHVIQVQSHFFDTPVSNNSNTFSKFLSCTITPKFNTSKFYLNASIMVGTNHGAFAYLLARRNTTSIAIGSSRNNRPRISASAYDPNTENYIQESVSISFLDSPTTTEASSALEYSISFRTPNTSSSYYVHINRNDRDNDASAADPSMASHLTVFEIAQ